MLNMLLTIKYISCKLYSFEVKQKKGVEANRKKHDSLSFHAHDETSLSMFWHILGRKQIVSCRLIHRIRYPNA